MRPFLEPLPHEGPPADLDAMLLEATVAWLEDLPRVAAAILAIQQGGLWTPRYESFEALCITEWGFTARFARAVIATGIKRAANGGEGKHA